jgi:hypothetical protein
MGSPCSASTGPVIIGGIAGPQRACRVVLVVHWTEHGRRGKFAPVSSPKKRAGGTSGTQSRSVPLSFKRDGDDNDDDGREHKRSHMQAGHPDASHRLADKRAGDWYKVPNQRSAVMTSSFWRRWLEFQPTPACTRLAQCALVQRRVIGSPLRSPVPSGVPWCSWGFAGDHRTGSGMLAVAFISTDMAC